MREGVINFAPFFYSIEIKKKALTKFVLWIC